ncbi:MAG: hypothetical protein ACE5GQ_12275 [Nitrospinales bacterium]
MKQGKTREVSLLFFHKSLLLCRPLARLSARNGSFNGLVPNHCWLFFSMKAFRCPVSFLSAGKRRLPPLLGFEIAICDLKDSTFSP